MGHVGQDFFEKKKFKKFRLQCVKDKTPEYDILDELVCDVISSPCATCEGQTLT